MVCHDFAAYCPPSQTASRRPPRIDRHAHALMLASTITGTATTAPNEGPQDNFHRDILGIGTPNPNRNFLFPSNVTVGWSSETAPPNGETMAAAVDPSAPAPEISTLRICCLLNRIHQAFPTDSNGGDDHWSADRDCGRTKTHEDPDTAGGSQDRINGLKGSETIQDRACVDDSDGEATKASRVQSTSDQTSISNKSENRTIDLKSGPTKPSWPVGEFFKAVKVGGLGATVTLVRGRKYLLITPYQSPVLSLTDRHNKRTSNTSATKGRKRARSTSSSPYHRGPFNRNAQPSSSVSSQPNTFAKDEKLDIAASHPHETYQWDVFERYMARESDRSQRGRCGLYELFRVEDVSSINLAALKRNRNAMLVCLPSDQKRKNQSTDSTSNGVHGGRRTTATSSMDKPVAASNSKYESPSSSSEQPTESLNHSVQSRKEQPTASGRPPSMNLPCRCEIVRAKALVMRELLATLMIKSIQRLKMYFRAKNSSSKGKEPALSKLESGSWNFLDIIKNSANIWSKDEVDFSWVPNPMHPGEVDRPKVNFEFETAVSCRLQLIRQLHLATIVSSNMGSSRDHVKSIVPQPSMLHMLQSLLIPVHRTDGQLCLVDDVNTDGKSFVSDSSLLTQDIVDALDKELDRRVTLVRQDFVRLNSRLRLLSAIRDMLHVMRRTSRLKDDDEDEDCEDRPTRSFRPFTFGEAIFSTSASSTNPGPLLSPTSSDSSGERNNAALPSIQPKRSETDLPSPPESEFHSNPVGDDQSNTKLPSSARQQVDLTTPNKSLPRNENNSVQNIQPSPRSPPTLLPPIESVSPVSTELRSLSNTGPRERLPTRPTATTTTPSLANLESELEVEEEHVKRVQRFLDLLKAVEKAFQLFNDTLCVPTDDYRSLSPPPMLQESFHSWIGQEQIRLHNK